MEFRFDEDRKLGVFTCEHVMGGAPVLFVSHDEDGDWQFLCGAEHDEQQAALICLEDMVAKDPSLNQVAAMPMCHVAERAGIGAPWEHLDQTDEMIRECIDEDGWFVALFEAEDGDPAFAYSIGMFETLEHPEVIVVGQPVETMGGLINAIGSRARDGAPYAAGEPIDDLVDGVSCVLRRMHITHYRDYLGYALEYYEGPEFPVLQLVWPDAPQDLTKPKRTP